MAIRVFSYSVPYHPNMLPPKLCKDCKHFLIDAKSSIKYGYCNRFGSINLVDGSIRYEHATIAREYQCKGELFETKSGLKSSDTWT
jgi:hypothetical protein